MPSRSSHTHDKDFFAVRCKPRFGVKSPFFILTRKTHSAAIEERGEIRNDSTFDQNTVVRLFLSCLLSVKYINELCVVGISLEKYVLAKSPQLSAPFLEELMQNYLFSGSCAP